MTTAGTPPTTTTTTRGRPSVIPTEPVMRLSVDQYHEMIRADILTEDDPIELLDGLLVPKMPKNRPHSFATQTTKEVLQRVLPAGWYADAQEPITLPAQDSEPEPDVTVVRGDRRQNMDRHPGPQDLAVVVEVSHASLRRDRGWKQGIYASAGIVVYWIVNLVDRQVEVYTDPSGPAEQPAYRRRQDYGPADSVPLVIEGKQVALVPVSELLP